MSSSYTLKEKIGFVLSSLSMIAALAFAAALPPHEQTVKSLFGRAADEISLPLNVEDCTFHQKEHFFAIDRYLAKFDPVHRGLMVCGDEEYRVSYTQGKGTYEYVVKKGDMKWEASFDGENDAVSLIHPAGGMKVPPEGVRKVEKRSNPEDVTTFRLVEKFFLEGGMEWSEGDVSDSVSKFLARNDEALLRIGAAAKKAFSK